MPMIGRGIFQWDSKERRSDRYGTFALVSHDDDSETTRNGKKITFSDFTADDPAAFLDDKALSDWLGKSVSIALRVVETRQSRHIGDLFRGIAPTTPEVGEIIDLGSGVLFTEPSGWAVGDVLLGMRLDDGRDTDWMNPAKMYRAHDQTVEVHVELA